MQNLQHNRGLICLWAVAECGLGGIMHGLKIPFTGIFVGGIAAMCLYFIAVNSDDKKKAITEATIIVLLVKIVASPHSPWQAYVAVIFQALMAMLFLGQRPINRLKTFAFTIITQLESAIQKMAITVLVFGTDFIEALDKSGKLLMHWLGIHYAGNLIWPVFIGYVILHFIVGITLGLWLPNMEKQMNKLDLPAYTNIDTLTELKLKKRGYFFIVFALFIPLFIAYILDDKSLFNVFFRVLAITAIFIFVLTPLIKYLIKKYGQSKKNEEVVNEILGELPSLFHRYTYYLKWVNNEYRGLSKIKYGLLTLLHVSLKK